MLRASVLVGAILMLGACGGDGKAAPPGGPGAGGPPAMAVEVTAAFTDSSAVAPARIAST